MEEDGFGDNPNAKNTITINGAEDERTKAGNYSNEDYGDGYYLVEIYGYYCPKSGGSWKLFYKSAHTKIGISDPQRTTNTAYLFDVVTYSPAQGPKVTFTGISAVYGYEKAEIVAEVNEIAGQTNTYQWYKATSKDQSSNGEKIDGATSTTLEIEPGKNVGEYYYYLEITTTGPNGDTLVTNHPVTFTVSEKSGGGDSGGGDSGDEEDDKEPITPPHRPSIIDDKDLPKTTAECQKAFGSEYIYSDEVGACIIKQMIIPDTSAK